MPPGGGKGGKNRQGETETTMKRQWTEQEINEWYAKQPWLRGTNFLPSDCINRLDMWQSFGREEHLKTAETELKLSEETGLHGAAVVQFRRVL